MSSFSRFVREDDNTASIFALPLERKKREREEKVSEVGPHSRIRIVCLILIFKEMINYFLKKHVKYNNSIQCIKF